MNSLQVRGWPETQKVPGQDKARGQNGQLQGRPSLGTDRCFQRRIAGVQPRQDPGGTLRMNGVGERERERRHVRPALIKSAREREREKVTVTQTGGAESGNALFFTVAFIP